MAHRRRRDARGWHLFHRAALTALPPGHEQPVPGATFVNGFNVINIGGCRFADAYNQGSMILGQPVATFDGRGQSFELLRLACDPSNPQPALRVDNLGLQAMVLAGKTPAPDSPPDPVVAAFLQRSAETGLDPKAAWGRVMSPPLCDNGRCRQYLDNVRLDFRPNKPDSLRIAPLGCELALSCAAAQAAAANSGGIATVQLLFILVGAAALLGGVTLLLRGWLTTDERGRAWSG